MGAVDLPKRECSKGISMPTLNVTAGMLFPDLGFDLHSPQADDF